MGVSWDDGGLGGEVRVTELDALLQEKRSEIISFSFLSPEFMSKN